MHGNRGKHNEKKALSDPLFFTSLLSLMGHPLFDPRMHSFSDAACLLPDLSGSYQLIKETPKEKGESREKVMRNAVCQHKLKLTENW